MDWELKDPLHLQDVNNVDAFHRRVVYAYHLTTATATRFFPQIWLEYAQIYIQNVKNLDEARRVLREGYEANPYSFLLTCALAELEEQERNGPIAREIWEEFIQKLEEKYKLITEEYQQKESNIKDPDSMDGIKLTQIDMDSMDGDARERFRDLQRRTYRQREDIRELRDQSLKTIARVISLAWIHWIWLERRVEGILAARKVFSKARKALSGTVTWHVYIASARMEYHGSKNAQIAVKILEAGLKEFSKEAQYINEYIRFLISINDDASMLL